MGVWLGRWAALAAVATLAGCAGSQSVQPPDPSEEIVDRFRPIVENQGFVPLAFPTTAYAPGAIVEIVTTADGSRRLSFYSDMRTCGATEEDLRVRVGAAPGATVNRSFTAGANLSLALPGATIGPSANLVRSATLSFGAMDVASLDQIAIEAWRDRLIEAEDGAVPDICLAIVQDTPENLFIIREALALRDGEVAYEAEAGLNADLSAELANSVASIPSADAKVELTGDTTIAFAGPLYIGVKRLSYISGEARRLGARTLTLADPELDEAELRELLGDVAAN